MSDNRGLLGLHDDVLIRILLNLDPSSLYSTFLTSQKLFSLKDSPYFWERIYNNLHFPQFVSPEFLTIDYISVRFLINQLFQVSYLIERKTLRIDDQENSIEDEESNADHQVVDEESNVDDQEDKMVDDEENTIQDQENAMVDIEKIYYTQIQQNTQQNDQQNGQQNDFYNSEWIDNTNWKDPVPDSSFVESAKAAEKSLIMYTPRPIVEIDLDWPEETSQHESSFDDSVSSAYCSPYKITYTEPFEGSAAKKPIMLLISGIDLWAHYKTPSKELVELFLLQDCYGRNAIDWSILKQDQRSLDFIYQCILLLDKELDGEKIIFPFTLYWNDTRNYGQKYFNPKFKSLNYYFNRLTIIEWAAQCNQIEEFKKMVADKPIKFENAGTLENEFFNSYAYYNSVVTITATEGYIELLQLILSTAEMSNQKVRYEILLSAITAAVVGGQPGALQILLHEASKHRFFEDRLKVNSLAYLLHELACYALSNEVTQAIELLLPHITKAANLKVEEQFTGDSSAPNHISTSNHIINQPAKNSSQVTNSTDMSFLKELKNYDFEESFDKSKFVYSLIDKLYRKLVAITLNFEKISKDTALKNRAQNTILEITSHLSNEDIFSKYSGEFDHMITSWLFHTTFISSDFIGVNTSSRMVSVEVWEKSLNFFLSVAQIPEEKVLPCLFEILSDVYTVLNFNTAREKIAYCGLLAFCVKKGLNVNDKYTGSSYGTGSLISTNFVNQQYEVINDLLLYGAKIDYMDYLADNYVYELSSFSGFICDSNVENTTDLESAIIFKKEVILNPNIKIHPDYFMVCMNFDMINSLIAFVFIINNSYLSNDSNQYYSFDIDIDVDSDDDLTISLKSLILQVAKNHEIFDIAHKKWLSDDVNSDVMNREENSKIFKEVNRLLQNYTYYYNHLQKWARVNQSKGNKCFAKDHDDFFEAVQVSEVSEVSDVADVVLAGQQSQASCPAMLFSESKKRNLLASQLTDTTPVLLSEQLNNQHTKFARLDETGTKRVMN